MVVYSTCCTRHKKSCREQETGSLFETNKPTCCGVECGFYPELQLFCIEAFMPLLAFSLSVFMCLSHPYIFFIPSALANNVWYLYLESHTNIIAHPDIPFCLLGFFLLPFTLRVYHQECLLTISKMRCNGLFMIIFCSICPIFTDWCLWKITQLNWMENSQMIASLKEHIQESTSK